MAENPNEEAAAAILKDELEKARSKNQDYEKLLLDPNYLEFLSGGKAPRQEMVKAAQETNKEIDFDQMTNKDLVEYLLFTMQGMVARQVGPLAHSTQLDRVRDEVKEAAGKHEDFWEYKEEMIELGRRHPTLTAEEAYFQAKGKGRPKAARSEVPGGGGSTKKEQPKGFEGAFREAFARSGLRKE